MSVFVAGIESGTCLCRALCCCLCSNCGYCCYDEKRMAEKERRMKRKRQQEELRAQQLALQEPYYVRSNSLHNNLHSPDKQIQLTEIDSLSATESRTSMHGLSILAPILLCFSMMVIYIVLGALALVRLEGWSLLDGIYFCFMSLSTIGFGDMVPGMRKDSNTTMWFCSIYIMCGMALTAMCFNVLHEEIAHRLRHVVAANERMNASVEDPNDYLGSWRYEKNTNLYQRNPTEETLISGKLHWTSEQLHFLLHFCTFEYYYPKNGPSLDWETEEKIKTIILLFINFRTKHKILFAAFSAHRHTNINHIRSRARLKSITCAERLQ